MGIIEDLFNVIAPHECLVCRSEGNLLCQGCADCIKKVPERCYSCGRWSDGFRTCQSCRRHTPLYSVRAVTPYDGYAKDLVHSLKFARAKAGASVIARAIYSVFPAPEDLIITYVPTSNRRVRERGYDQAALIARELSRHSGLPCLPLLARSGSQRQLGQRREVRKKQLTDAFRPIQNIDLQGRHVLLVDDVLTTGATCESAARTLRRAGAKRVSAAVFAVA